MVNILVKVSEGYHLLNESRVIIGYSENIYVHGYLKLSLENCKMIELGYDFNELGLSYIKRKTEGLHQDEVEYYRSFLEEDVKCFIEGVKFFAEVSGEYQFRMKDIVLAFNAGLEHGLNPKKPNIIEYFKSLKKNEWYVSIDTSPCVYDDSLGGFSTSFKDGMPVEEPKLDCNGCISLNRIKLWEMGTRKQ